MEKHMYFPEYADDMAICYTIIDTDPLEIEISSILVRGAVVSNWLFNFLMDAHESEFIYEILQQLKRRRAAA